MIVLYGHYALWMQILIGIIYIIELQALWCSENQYGFTSSVTEISKLLSLESRQEYHAYIQHHKISILDHHFFYMPIYVYIYKIQVHLMPLKYGSYNIYIS